MELKLIETFTWTIATLLGFTFVFSLLVVAKKPKEFTQKNIKTKKKINEKEQPCFPL